jgi:hypothetical protein
MALIGSIARHPQAESRYLHGLGVSLSQKIFLRAKNISCECTRYELQNFGHSGLQNLRTSKLQNIRTSGLQKFRTSELRNISIDAMG